MLQNNQTLPKIIKDITLHYIKYYYDKHLQENNINIIEKNDLKILIDTLYNEKQKDLRDYIRNTLKGNLKGDYPKTSVETILHEMFEDQNFAKEKVIQEILIYQKNGK